MAQKKPPHRRTGRTNSHHGQGAGLLKAAAGGYFIWGWHAVAAALANPQRRIRRLLISGRPAAPRHGPTPLDQLLASLPKDRQHQLPAAEFAEPAQLDRLAGPDKKTVHQHIAIEAEALESPDLTDLLFGDHLLRLLVLDQVTDPHNIGAILRSAAAFGADALVLTARHAPEENGTLARTAAGALETVPMVRVTNLARALDQMHQAGVQIAGLEAGGGKQLEDLASEPRLALIMGAEGSGMRRLTREKCDHLAAIEMTGGLESLNVSVAAGIALYATRLAGKMA